jgi:hypothetical protein
LTSLTLAASLCDSEKLIKELPSLVPADEGVTEGIVKPDGGCESSVESSTTGRQYHGDKTGESGKIGKQKALPSSISIATSNAWSDVDQLHSSGGTHESESDSPETKTDPDLSQSSVQAMNKKPGEVAFFKLLHAELKKATHFFDRAEQEFSIREERIREGMEIMKKPIMVSEKWSLLAKSLYRLYKDLLLLETFAIMTYCAFSKILKKHDKVTGYDTRIAFMAHVVNKANFANYPSVLSMIQRCQTLYEKVSGHLIHEGKEGLYEDERLFINMVQRLNQQVMDAAESEGAETNRRPPKSTGMSLGAAEQLSTASRSGTPCCKLRTLVEENDASTKAAQIADGQNDDSLGPIESNLRKRSAELPVTYPEKRTRA